MTARYLTGARLDELAAKLRPRDWSLIAEIATLRFARSDQLARLCFVDASDQTPDLRAARRTLRRLVDLGVLERLPRTLGGPGGGSTDYIYRLGPAGQRLSMQRGWLPKRRARPYAVPGRLFVGHAVAAAELHARLVEAERRGRWELLERACEPACWRPFGTATLKPDSYIRLALGDFEYSYFIEVDRATEGSRAVENQLERYLDYFQTGEEQTAHGVFPKVLWLVPDADRVAVIADLIDRLSPPERELFAVTEFGEAIRAMTPATGSIEPALESTM